MEPTESQLIASALQGEVEAFRVLFQRHWRMAVGVAFCLTRDRHLAEDAAQEAFAMAARQLATLRDAERFPHWLRAICRRIALRLHHRRPPVIALSIDPPAVVSECLEPRRTALLIAIDQLDAEVRELVVLHYFSEMSYADISRTLGISEGSVHGRLQRARRKLADFVSRETSSGANHVPFPE